MNLFPNKTEKLLAALNQDSGRVKVRDHWAFIDFKHAYVGQHEGREIVAVLHDESYYRVYITTGVVMEPEPLVDFHPEREVEIVQNEARLRELPGNNKPDAAAPLAERIRNSRNTLADSERTLREQEPANRNADRALADAMARLR